ncbi:ABC transporter permease [Mycobacterium sp. NAZ190054]|uniref:ABC transporter permease n=1 Tax=Mycobacterium sp. NAZ190054 TaxID=1747766 RepID=UPI0018D2576D|nr:ABC transporter permease [Mycobacterium sp. NAZ190054]
MTTIQRRDVPDAAPVRIARRRPKLAVLLVIPALAFLTVFFFWPLVAMLLRSFTDPSPANYAELLNGSLYWRTLGRTLVIAGIVSVTCIMLAYPYAYLMRLSGSTMRNLLMALILLPFWTSWLVRTFSWTTILQDSGVLNTLLIDLGLLSQPLPLIRTNLAVVIGLTHIMLPFMVLPIYAGMVRIDLDMVNAARGLGASSFTAFRAVFLPLSMPGVFTGTVLVFVVSAGFYVVPALLGGPSSQMFSQLVVIYFREFLDFGFGSALAVVLLVATLAAVAVLYRTPVVRRAMGSAERK